MICRPPYMDDRKVILAIVNDASKVFGISPKAILGYSRKREVAHARHAVFAEAHMRGISSPRIGAVMNRDHSSVLHGIKRALERGDVKHG